MAEIARLPAYRIGPQIGRDLLGLILQDRGARRLQRMVMSPSARSIASSSETCAGGAWRHGLRAGLR